MFRKEISMSRKLILALTLILSFALAGWCADAKDGDAIHGAWLPATAELGGKTFPDEVRKSIKLVIKDDKYTVTVGKAVDQGTIKLHPAARPKKMDITGTDG